jgi:hypothetical protein
MGGIALSPQLEWGFSDLLWIMPDSMFNKSTGQITFARLLKRLISPAVRKQN